jgi:AhpD family alkylhydroperoxidase
MAQQEKLSSEISELWDIYKKCMPAVACAYDELPMEVYKDGVLSGKIKRLMAVVSALVRGYKACILFQTEEALSLGATAEEIMEACAVAISLSNNHFYCYNRN